MRRDSSESLWQLWWVFLSGLAIVGLVIAVGFLRRARIEAEEDLVQWKWYQEMRCGMATGKAVFALERSIDAVREGRRPGPRRLDVAVATPIEICADLCDTTDTGSVRSFVSEMSRRVDELLALRRFDELDALMKALDSTALRDWPGIPLAEPPPLLDVDRAMRGPDEQVPQSRVIDPHD